MSMRSENEKKAHALSRDELVQIAVNVFNKRDQDRFRKLAERRDEQEAEAELAGQDPLPIEMPTLLDSHVRVQNDDGATDWKTRDEASVKEHLGMHDHMEAVHTAASGIRRRKRDRLSDWSHDQGPRLDQAAPIGDYIWQHVRCAICGGGPEKIRELGTFVEAHTIAVKFGGTETRWAHKLCNEMEGVG